MTVLLVLLELLALPVVTLPPLVFLLLEALPLTAVWLLELTTVTLFILTILVKVVPAPFTKAVN